MSITLSQLNNRLVVCATLWLAASVLTIECSIYWFAMFFKAAMVHSKYNAARLDCLKAETLVLHCLKSDLTMMFSIIWGFVDIDCNSLFQVINCESVHTRGHNLRLYKEHCNVNCRLNALSAATLMSGTDYQLMSWTATVSQYLSEDWHA